MSILLTGPSETSPLSGTSNIPTQIPTSLTHFIARVDRPLDILRCWSTTNRAKVRKFNHHIDDIISLNWFRFNFIELYYSRLWPCKIHTKNQQLRLQSSCLRLQLLLDERLHAPRVQEGKDCIAVPYWKTLLLRWALLGCGTNQRKFLLKSIELNDALSPHDSLPN